MTLLHTPPHLKQLICSYVFYPLAVVMGTSLDDCRMVAELIGVKTFINEFAAYERLGVLIRYIVDIYLSVCSF